MSGHFKSNPTPGPWEAVISDPRGQPSAMYRGLIALCERGDRYLAVASDGRTVQREEWEPNCRLIAAAPDLLAACAAALLLHQSADFCVNNARSGQAFRDSDNRLRAAIAKAKEPK